MIIKFMAPLGEYDIFMLWVSRSVRWSGPGSAGSTLSLPSHIGLGQARLKLLAGLALARSLTYSKVPRPDENIYFVF